MLDFYNRWKLCATHRNRHNFEILCKGRSVIAIGFDDR